MALTLKIQGMSSTQTAQFDLFYYTESNHHHPINDANAKCVSISNCGSDGNWRFAGANEAIAAAISEGLIGKGSARCGVTEVQTDAGIWMRIGSNGFSKGKVSNWDFKTWAQLEAEE